MSARHTPGPWKAHQDCIIPVVPPSGSPNDGHVILFGGEFVGPDGFWNKQLCIGAPDMLVALKSIAEQATPYDNDPHGVLGFVHRVALAAISKAEGRS